MLDVLHKVQLGQIEALCVGHCDAFEHMIHKFRDLIAELITLSYVIVVFRRDQLVVFSFF